jgi:predicted phage terminase large subunit-like protein
MSSKLSDDHLIGHLQSQQAALVRQAALHDFETFLLYDGEGRWRRAPHLTLLCDILQQASLPGAGVRAVIEMPPRHGKSEACSRKFPPWVLGKRPDCEIILATYAADLSEDMSRVARSTLRRHHDLFKIKISSDSQAVNRWGIADHRGGMVACGVGGPLTGRGADILIIDDPHKNWEEAQSRARRDAVWNWWLTVARTRLAPGGSVIIIMTRWHPDDLVGRLQNTKGWKNHRWQELKLRCFASADKDDPLGRQPGEMLWPGRFSIEELAEIRADFSPQQFDALYQQEPAMEGGQIFKREWWRYKRREAFPVFHRMIQSWDTAFKKGQENDYSVCTTWGEADDGYYLVDLWRNKVEYPDLKRVMQTNFDRFRGGYNGGAGVTGVLVEDAASGQDIIAEFKRGSSIPILAVKVSKDKLIRAHAVTPVVESGRAILPEGDPWVHDYVNRMCDFPQVDFDDEIDSTTQGLSFLVAGGGKTGMLEFYARQVRAMQLAQEPIEVTQ